MENLNSCEFLEGLSCYQPFEHITCHLTAISRASFVQVPSYRSARRQMNPGADPGEVKWVNFHPPFSEPPSFFFFVIPQILTSNTSTRLWFYYILTKIHPPFQNPGSAPGTMCFVPLDLRVSLNFAHICEQLFKTKFQAIFRC